MRVKSDSFCVCLVFSVIRNLRTENSPEPAPANLSCTASIIRSWQYHTASAEKSKPTLCGGDYTPKICLVERKINTLPGVELAVIIA